MPTSNLHHAIPRDKQITDFVDTIYDPPKWATGYVSELDAEFLCTLIKDLQPRTIVEIGMASGVSTVILSRIIETHLPRTHLLSFDLSNVYYADKSKRVGQYLYDVYGDPPKHVRLFPGVAAIDASDSLTNQAGIVAVDFAFIDANHNHPWPCLDLLGILQILTPGSWVALHDINLSFIHAKWETMGPHYLFYNWPGEKATLNTGKDFPNIGAIKLLDDPAQCIDAIFAALRLPWQVKVAPELLSRMCQRVDLIRAGANQTLKAIANSHSLSRDEENRILKGCKLSVENVNRYTRVDGDITNKTSVLHANGRREPPVRFVTEGINVEGYSNLTFSMGARAGNTRRDGLASISVFESNDGSLISRQSFEVPRARVSPVIIPVPAGSKSLKIEISLCVPGDVDTLDGCWAEVGPFRLSKL